MSKQQERRAKSPRKRKNITTKKTGPLADNLSLGYRPHANALAEKELINQIFIPKVK